MSEKFLLARTVLTNELNKIGGEIFAKEVMKLRAKQGDEEAKSILDTEDLFTKIFSKDLKDTEAERKLAEIIDAIHVLYNAGQD